MLLEAEPFIHEATDASATEADLSQKHTVQELLNLSIERSRALETPHSCPTTSRPS